MPRTMKLDYQDIDDYISQQPVAVQNQLKQLRSLIRRLAPAATEHISYGMPTFKIKKVLAHFAAQKNHIGFYPGPEPIVVFKEKLKPFSTSKGTIRFEISKPLPLEVISEIINYNKQQLINRMTEQPVIVSQYFNHSKDKIWRAITDHEKMIQWFFEDIPSFSPEVGFKSRFIVENEGRVFPHLWEIIEVINEEKIVLDWRYEGYEGSSIVTFSLVNKESGCLLTVEHINTSSYDTSIPEFKRESCQGGWDYFIKERLAQFLDNC